MSVEMLIGLKSCIWCGGTSLVRVTFRDLARYESGVLAQDVWPDWSPEKRESFISGTHPYCWDEMFSDDESEYSAQKGA